MASTYSPSLRIELIGTGDQSGTWGVTTNTNLGSVIEQAITGYQSIAMTDADYTLTVVDGGIDQARNAVIKMTGALTATRSVIIPSVEKLYVFNNATTGSQSITVKTAAGAAITVPNGTTVSLYCDATDCFPASTWFTGNISLTGTGAAQMNVGSSSNRPTPSVGMLRFNTDIPSFEGYNGTAWTSVGGSSISNDVATASNLYPLFANATSGTALNVYTSNANYLYKPSEGALQALEMVAANGIVAIANSITTSYAMPANYNALNVGPVTVASGATFTISSGSYWTVL